MSQQGRKRCPKCGSTYIQSLEAAYESSTRISESGYKTTSQLGERVAPPVPRSEIGGALFTAGGLGSGALVFAPAIIPSMSTLDFMDKTNLTISGCVAIVAFLVSLRARIRYNVRHWGPDYCDWQEQSICRSCLHQFRA